MARAKKTVELQGASEPLLLGEFEAMQGICDVNVSPPAGMVGTGAVFSELRPTVAVFSLSETAQTPRYATEGSACFDLRADFTGHESVKVFTAKNEETTRRINHQNNIVMFEQGDRAMIPTNLIFDIPPGYKILVYPRSGSSLKRGITLANSVGVIDSDYVEPSFVLAKFDARVGGHVSHGEAIAQAELVPVTQASVVPTTERPAKKTTRNGGFGSTGN